MPKTVRRSVSESLEELEHVERVYRGRPEEVRARFLRVLRTQPELTFDEAAGAAGVPRRTAYRWWRVYQERALIGLLNLNLGRPVGSRKIPETVRKTNDVHSGLTADELLGLINGMPTQLGMLDGINGLRDRLMAILPDVDRISISVNTHCDLEDPGGYQPKLNISQRPEQGGGIDEGVEVSWIQGVQTPAEDILEQMRKGGFPFDRYHPPVAFDLWYEGTADLGAIVFWREVDKSPISGETLARIETLRPFLIYVYSNLVIRHHYANPRDRVFYSSLRDMAERAQLTAQERRIISYRLMGYSYKRIAAELGRTEGAVKKQIASVHRKTGTQGHSELFAKYFTPRLVSDQ